MAEPNNAPRERHDSGTRLVATLVLVPTIPLLLISLVALIGFYVSPERFNRLLERLPGTDFLRVALVFAPATLLGVVILAILYARQEPSLVRETPVRQPAARFARAWAAAILVPLVPLLLASAALLILSFVAPGRYDLLMKRLPGEAFLRPAVQVAPYLLFFVALLAGTYVLGDGDKGEVRAGSMGTPPAVRVSVGLILVPAVPLLLLSLTGLAALYVAPERVERLLTRLGSQAFVRLSLILVPAALMALVAVAALYLLQPRSRDDSALEPRAPGLWRWLSAAGLILSAVVGTGLLAVVGYLVLR